MLLAEVRHSPGLGVSELATVENVARSVMSERVKRLEAAGLIACDPTLQRDRRRIGLVITKVGRELLEVITVRRRTWMAERLTALSAEEREAVQTAVTSLERIISIPNTPAGTLHVKEKRAAARKQREDDNEKV